MIYSLHDLHLVLDFLIEDAVLHKTSFLQLLSRVWVAIELGGDFMDDSKGALSDLADFIVPIGTSPLPREPVDILLSSARR